MTWLCDIGPRREVYPDWEAIEVDDLAQWIIKQLPDEQWETTVRAICASIELSENNSDDTNTFLRMSKDKTILLCHIKEIETEDSDPKTVICGEVRYENGSIEASSNSVMITGIPDSISATMNPGEKLSKYIEVESHSDRIILDTKKTEDVILIQLEPQDRQTFWDLYGDA